MSSFLIDYENVKSDGLAGVSDLSNEDIVYIFYSENADKLTFDLHRRLNESKAQIVYQKVEVGHKNALDFQLVTFLGYLIAKDSDGDYVIVSNDTGYNSAVKFWKSESCNVRLVADLKGTDKVAEADKIYRDVKALIEDEKEARFVSDCIIKYKTKQGLNNALVKQYDSQKGGQLYKLIKPLIKDKKGN